MRKNVRYVLLGIELSCVPLIYFKYTGYGSLFERMTEVKNSLRRVLLLGGGWWWYWICLADRYSSDIPLICRLKTMPRGLTAHGCAALVKHSATFWRNSLPKQTSPLSFQHNLKLLIISRLLLLFFCKEDKRHWEERHSFTLTGKSTLITAAFTMVWRFCRLSPVITISIKCLSVKVILTVGCVSPLVSTHLLCPYKFSTITCQGFFSFFFSKSRNYSCLLSPLSSWHHSSIIQFLIWLFEVCSLVWRQVSLC